MLGDGAEQDDQRGRAGDESGRGAEREDRAPVGLRVGVGERVVMRVVVVVVVMMAAGVVRQWPAETPRSRMRSTRIPTPTTSRPATRFSHG